MKKYKVKITRVEYYSMTVVVEAENLDEAIEKTEKKWEHDEYLYERLQDFQDDTETKFHKCGLASESDINKFITID